MTPVMLGSAAGAAALTIGQGAASAVGNGLSFAAELVKGISGTSAPQADGDAGKDSLQALLTQRIAALRDRIRQQLAAAGIDLSKPIELTSDGAGGIAAVADHPQHEAIQDLLNRDFLLERDFQQLATNYDDFVLQHGPGDGPAKLTIIVPANGTNGSA